MNRPMAPDEAEEASFRYAGWRVVFACFVMALVCWGFGFYGHAFYLAELQRLHGWPTSWISTAASLYYFVAAILVAFVSDGIRKFGPRNCVLAGAVSFAIAVTALPFIRSPAQLYAVYLVMTVGWATMSVAAITNIIGPWFSARRGLAISFALNGASLSGVVIVPALVFLAGKTSFTVAMLTGAVLILVCHRPARHAGAGGRTRVRNRSPACRKRHRRLGPEMDACHRASQQRLLERIGAVLALAHVAGRVPGAHHRLPGTEHGPQRRRHRRRGHHRHGHRRTPRARRTRAPHRSAHGERAVPRQPVGRPRR